MLCYQVSQSENPTDQRWYESIKPVYGSERWVKVSKRPPEAIPNLLSLPLPPTTAKRLPDFRGERLIYVKRYGVRSTIRQCGIIRFYEGDELRFKYGCDTALKAEKISRYSDAKTT